MRKENSRVKVMCPALGDLDAAAVDRSEEYREGRGVHWNGWGVGALETSDRRLGMRICDL